MDRSEQMNTNAKTGGMKASKRARMDLIPWNAIWKVAELYGDGAAKYSAHNWRKGYDWSLSFQSMMRHAALYWEGEEYDPEFCKDYSEKRAEGLHLHDETCVSHMTAVVFHALALITFAEEYPEGDDRPHVSLSKNQAKTVLSQMVGDLPDDWVKTKPIDSQYIPGGTKAIWD